MTGRVVSFLAVLLLTLSGVGAMAQESVRTRAASHPDYGRIVFDWPYRVGFSADIEGEVLTVRFDSPLSTDLDRALRRVRGYVKSGAVSADGQVVRLELDGPHTASTFRNGTAIVVDLRRSGRPREPKVRVRVGQHPAFTRLVFDWDEPVDFEAQSLVDGITLRFEKPAQFDLPAIASRLPVHLTEPRAEKTETSTTFQMSARAEHRLRTFRSGNKIVIDILDPRPSDAELADARPEDAPAAPPVPEQVAPEQPAPIALVPPQVGAENGGVPDAIPPTSDAGPETPALPAPGAPETPPGPVASNNPQPLPETPPALPQAPAPAPEAPGGPAESVAETPSESAPPPNPAPVSDVAAAEPQAAPEAEAPQEPDLPVFTPTDGRVEQSVDLGAPDLPLGTLTFRWQENVGAAVYRRGGHLWILFDAARAFDIDQLRQEGGRVVIGLEQVPADEVTILRMRTPPGVNPRIRREGLLWIAEFHKASLEPPTQVEIQAAIDPDEGPRLLIPVDEPGTVIQFRDPGVGDVLFVATLRGSGHGVRGQRVYPEFSLLESAQGVVVERMDQRVRMVRTFNGFALSSKNGLHMTAISPEEPVNIGSVVSSVRLFAPSEWKRGRGVSDFTQVRTALLRTVVEVPIEKRNDARLDFARFLFARGMGHEAIGVLQVAESEDNNITNNPEFKALRGATNLLAGRVDTALEDLGDPRLDGFQEVILWRAAIQAEKANWARAAELFAAADSLLREYPQPLKTRLGLLRAEAALATGDIRTAGSWLGSLLSERDQLSRSQQNDLQYHLGRVAQARQNLDEAIGIWNGLVTSLDLRNSARAEYALINLGLKQETMTPADAIDRLERLRFRWRGDLFELNVLRRLGRLHLGQKAYYEGLSTLRAAVNNFPKHPASQQLAQEMTEIFRALYIGGEADNLSPLKALALYDEFRELTPSGPDGDYMIEKLADRLIDVDLLNRAAELMEHQIKFRLQGEDKARVGAKTAVVRLLDRDPPAALDALGRTNFPNLPTRLEDDRRRIRAKAMFEMGRHDEAITLLAGDITREADMLRRDIYWREENWTESAKVLQRLAGQPLPAGVGYEAAQARFVLNWAVALRLNEDEQGLTQLRELYGPAMALSPLADSFQFIASPGAVGGDLTSTLEELAREDHFEAFLTNYRERLVAERDAPDLDGSPEPILNVEPAPDPASDPFAEPDAPDPDEPPSAEPAPLPLPVPES